MTSQPQVFRVQIQEIMIDPVTNLPVVILSVPEREKVLPLWVGLFEANAIALELEGIVAPRPMTHDLFKNAVQAMGGTVTRVGLTGFRENTFFATVFIQHRGEELKVDARPSDAFSLALRFRVPIYVDGAILESVETFDTAERWFNHASSDVRGDAG